MTPDAPATDRGARRGRREQLQQRRLRRCYEDLQPLRPLHHARLPELDAARHLRRLVSDRPGSGISSAIRIEMIHETRVIPLDNRPHVSKGDRARHGRSARPLGRQHARRRDDELPGPQHLSQRQSGKMRLVEKFTRTSPTTIEWSVTVDDPTTWTRPWTFSMPLTMNDDRAGLRVRVPRRQLRDDQHPERITRRRKSGGHEIGRSTRQAAKSGQRLPRYPLRPPSLRPSSRSS